MLVQDASTHVSLDDGSDQRKAEIGRYVETIHFQLVVVEIGITQMVKRNQKQGKHPSTDEHLSHKCSERDW